MQAICIILNFLVATFKKICNKQVKLILITFYLIQNIIISMCNQYKNRDILHSSFHTKYLKSSTYFIFTAHFN